VNPIFAAALDVQAFCSSKGWKSCFIGTLAVQRRGEPRLSSPCRTRVVLLSSGSGIPIDVALGAMAFEERATDRATDFVVQKGHALTTCSAEDLVGFKAFAGREKDWLDIEGIVLRQAGRLDEQLIWGELHAPP
jgi:hypothetical protein